MELEKQIREAIEFGKQALESHDYSKTQAAIGHIHLANQLQQLVNAVDNGNGRKQPTLPVAPAPQPEPEMTWPKVGAIIAGVLLPLVGLLGWGHNDLSRDIDRVERSVGELRTNLDGFKDQTYDRFAEIQSQIASTRAEVADLKVRQDSSPPNGKSS